MDGGQVLERRECLIRGLFILATMILAVTGHASDWSVIGNGNQQQYFSTLKQINNVNVRSLGLAWYTAIPSQDGLVGNPLVVDGIVYQSGALSRVYASDVRTGRLLWKYSPPLDLQQASLRTIEGSRWNRGVAIYNNEVLVGSADCRLIAIDRQNGRKIWDSVACDTTVESVTGAPRVGDGKVFIGQMCAESGVGRGSIRAFDAQTGRELWRFYTVPGPPPIGGYRDPVQEMASKTWGSGEWWKKSSGCGSTWDAITYDPVTRLVFVGTDGPSPIAPTQRSSDAGDELFTNSIVALDADTGKYVWHYKTTPHDGWNFDATMHIMVADLRIKGRTRHVVMEAPKNGFFYVLDAATGMFITANNYTAVNWAKGIDPTTGRPIPLSDANYWEKEDGTAVASPGPIGAHNWQAMAYNPAAGLVYIPVIVMPTLMKYRSDVGAIPDPYYGLGGDPKWHAYGELVAWNPISQRARWRTRLPLPINGGILSTAGNLVFQGTADGYFNAYRATDGERLWSQFVGESIMAAPTTVEVDGEQIVLVPAGNSTSSILGTYLAKSASTAATRGPSRLLAFKLGGELELPKDRPTAILQPPRPKQPAELASKGRLLFDAYACADCHGLYAESAHGSPPDLRNMSAKTHQEFEAVVLGGARKSKGMPPFSDLSAADVEALHAYLINQAWADYQTQESRKGRQ